MVGYGLYRGFLPDIMCECLLIGSMSYQKPFGVHPLWRKQQRANTDWSYLMTKKEFKKTCDYNRGENCSVMHFPVRPSTQDNMTGQKEHNLTWEWNLLHEIHCNLVLLVMKLPLQDSKYSNSLNYSFIKKYYSNFASLNNDSYVSQCKIVMALSF